MIKVILKRANGSIYWREEFKTLQEADKWIKNEQSKSYWLDTNIVETIDKTAEVEAEKEAAAIAYTEKLAQKELAASKLVGIGGLTATEINALFGTELE